MFALMYTQEDYVTQPPRTGRFHGFITAEVGACRAYPQKVQGRKKLTVKECVILVDRFRGLAGAFLKRRSCCSMNVHHLRIALYADIFLGGVKLLYIICLWLSKHEELHQTDTHHSGSGNTSSYSSAITHSPIRQGEKVTHHKLTVLQQYSCIPGHCECVGGELTNTGAER